METELEAARMDTRKGGEEAPTFLLDSALKYEMHFFHSRCYFVIMLH